MKRNTFWLSLFCLFMPLVLSAQGSAYTPEYLYARFDKSFYVAGEDLWYAIYFMDPATSKSKIVYTELINPEGKLVDQQMLAVQTSHCFSDFALSPTLQEGYYLFRAYTQYNLNFEPQEIYQRYIPVYRADRKSRPAKLAASIDMPEFQSGENWLHTSSEAYSLRDTVQIQIRPQSPLQGDAHISISVFQKEYYSADENILNRNQQIQGQEPVTLAKGQDLIEPEETLQKTFILKHPQTEQLIQSSSVVCFVEATQQQLIRQAQNGIVNFSFGKFYGNSLIQIFDANPYMPTISPEVSLLHQSNPVQAAVPKSEPLPMTNEIWLYIQKYQQRFQLNQLFGSAQQIRAARQAGLASPYEPTTVYKMDDFVIPGGMEGFIKQVISPVRIKKSKGKEPTAVMNDFYERNFWLYVPHKGRKGDALILDKPPLLRVNEYFTYNTKAVMELDWASVRQIEVYNSVENLRKQFGVMGDYGSIAFMTRDGKTPESIKEAGNYLQIEGFYHPRTYSVPDRQTSRIGQSKIPDFRPQMYWNPNVIVKAESETQIQFLANDQPGLYIIQMEGLTADGIPIFEQRPLIIR